MTPADFNELLLRSEKNGRNIPFSISAKTTLNIYPASVIQTKQRYYFIARSCSSKHLYILLPQNESPDDSFEYTYIEGILPVEQYKLALCPMNHTNARALMNLFDFCRPKLLGTANSFGLGDRLGIANPGQLRALAGTGIRVVLAQQSIRELERTVRKPEDVMDAAVWAVFQEGYREGFGADADHLKTPDDIDVMARAGFTMFTFDPGEYVVNDAGSYPLETLERMAAELSWNVLEDTFEGFMTRYEHAEWTVANDYILSPSRLEILRSMVKYSGVIVHTLRMYRHITLNYPDRQFEIELSVDETDSPTTPFEHFLVANELKRLGVRLVSLAPRFVGDFEKGIDYKGNLDLFREEYIKHLNIANYLGPYKISLHSGSDKFSVYEVIGSLTGGNWHVKTAGTSYLVALQTIAVADPSLFREILAFSRNHYDNEKASYHVSADVANVPASENLSDIDLDCLFDDDNAREVLHVTFGKVLTEKSARGKYVFKERILSCLESHEDMHYNLLDCHFKRHIRPFLQ